MSQQFLQWGAQSRTKSHKTLSKRTTFNRPDKRLERSTIGDQSAPRHIKGHHENHPDRREEKDQEQDRALQERLEKEAEEMVEVWRKHKGSDDDEELCDGPTHKLKHNFGSFSYDEFKLACKPFQRRTRSEFLNFVSSFKSGHQLDQIQSTTELPPIFLIPGRIRFKVYQYLNIRDRISCQCVCRQMRNEVRRFAGIVANVSERTTWGTSFMRDIVCETVRVKRFQQPKLTPMQLIYKRLFVKHLCFVGSIPHRFVDAFAFRCPNVQRISVYGEVTEKMLYPKHSMMRKQIDGWRVKDTISRFPRRLCHVWQLYIGPPVKYALETVPIVLKMFRYPHLKRLIIKIDDFLPINQAKEIHLAIFDALQTRLYHIKELVIKTVISPEDSRFRGHLYLHRPTDSIIRVSRQRQLNRFTFTDPILDYQLWGLFLCEQKRLKTLQFLQLVQLPVYLYIIPRNRHTLVVISIHVCLWVRKSVPMKLDLALFAICSSLKDLFIHVKAPFIPGKSDVFNFKRLPTSLEVLAIHNCLAHTSDMAAVSKLPNLKSLGMVMVKKPDLLEYCLNCHTLKRLLRTRKLDELYLNGFCLSKCGAVTAHKLGPLCSALTRGYTNMFFMRHPNPEESRWVEVHSEKQIVYKLVKSWGFDLPHLTPPRGAE